MGHIMGVFLQVLGLCGQVATLTVRIADRNRAHEWVHLECSSMARSEPQVVMILS